MSNCGLLFSLYSVRPSETGGNLFQVWRLERSWIEPHFEYTLFVVNSWQELTHTPTHIPVTFLGNGIYYALGLPGVTAQGGVNGGAGDVNIPDPRSLFSTHAINRNNVTSEIYDPSYGYGSRIDLNNWDNQSISYVKVRPFAILTDASGNLLSTPEY